MLKRFATLLMMLLYTVTSMGIALNLHYCFNQVSSVIVNKPVKNCLKTTAVKAKKCCKEQHLEIKVKDGHQAAAVNQLTIKLFAADVPQLYTGYLVQSLIDNTGYQISYRGPPDLSLSQPPVYLSNRNFRI